MLSFEDLNFKNWPLFEETILNNQQIFPEQIRTAKEDFLSIIYSPNQLSLVLKYDANFAGNAIGYPLEDEQDMKEHDIDHIPIDGKTIYLFEFLVSNQFQGKGLGHKLLMEFIRKAKEKGFERIVGDFRPNGSLSLMRKLNAKEIKVHKNWENTGEDFVLCELDIRNFNLTAS
jgi:GNAT superfamily N-acetyltransferase